MFAGTALRKHQEIENKISHFLHTVLSQYDTTINTKIQIAKQSKLNIQLTN